MTPTEIKALPLNEKVEYFRSILANVDNECPEDILNVFRLTNTYNIFDDDFFSADGSYINDISEFIDLRQALKEDVDVFYNALVFWYLSLIASADIPSTPPDDAVVVQLPPLFHGYFALGSIYLFASILNRCTQRDFSLDKLARVRDAFLILGDLTNKNSISSMLLQTLTV